MNKKEFCVFILTYGRAKKVRTVHTLRKGGYTGKIFLVCSTDDNQIEEYKNLYGEDVIIFNKDDYKGKFDIADNFEKDNVVVYARNACFDISSKLGYKYFLVLDDDYENFRYKFDNEYKFGCFILHQNLDNIFKATLQYYKTINALTISYSQGGDYIGGGEGQGGESIHIKRKVMNTFFCSIERRFNFLGRINEDVNAYVFYGNKGGLMFQINNFAVWQMQTQANSGGLTEFYLDGGTYLKSFYTVIFAPSCTKVALMGAVNPRLHHKIYWEHAVPKIISQNLRKKK